MTPRIGSKNAGRSVILRPITGGVKRSATAVLLSSDEDTDSESTFPIISPLTVPELLIEPKSVEIAIIIHQISPKDICIEQIFISTNFTWKVFYFQKNMLSLKYKKTSWWNLMWNVEQ